MKRPGLILAAVLLLLTGCEKDHLDAQVREMCAKDGGIKVYETVRLSPEKFDKYGAVKIPSKQDAKQEDQYYYESRMHHYKSGNPEMWQLHFMLYRRIDNKLIGEAISYARRGGDLPGPWHASSFGCPDDSDISDLKKRIFIRAD